MLSEANSAIKALVELEHIDLTFNPGTVNETCLFEDFNFRVDQGEFVSVVGSNGSGKTSMLNLICGTLSGLAMILGREQVPSDLLPAAPSLLYLGIFATGVCYLMQTQAQTVLSAPQAGIVMSMEGFFGSLLSLLFGQAAFRPLMALGGLLVTGSVLLSSLPEKSLSASEKTPDRSDA